MSNPSLGHERTISAFLFNGTRIEKFKIYFGSWPAVADCAVAITDNIQVDSIIHFKTRHMKTTLIQKPPTCNASPIVVQLYYKRLIIFMIYIDIGRHQGELFSQPASATCSKMWTIKNPRLLLQC